jgi:hypothetical protein
VDLQCHRQQLFLFPCPYFSSLLARLASVGAVLAIHLLSLLGVGCLRAAGLLWQQVPEIFLLRDAGIFIAT